MLTYESLRHKSYIEIIFKGSFSFEEIKALILEIYQNCEQENISRIFVDLTSMSNYNPTQMDRFYLGTFISEVFNPKFKIGVLDKISNINKFAETVAKNRMINMYVSDYKKDILIWLQADQEL